MNIPAPLPLHPAVTQDEGRTTADVRGRTNGRVLAQAACIVGLLFAAVSIYWGLGGTRMLDTVGASLAEQPGR